MEDNNVTLEHMMEEQVVELFQNVFSDDDASSVDYETRARLFALEAGGEEAVVSTLYQFSTNAYEVFQADKELPEFLMLAVICSRVARLLPMDAGSRLVVLRHLAIILTDLFDISGNKEHLDEAIRAARGLLFISREMMDDPSSMGMYEDATTTLVELLDRRYVEYRFEEDLDEALRLAQEALNITRDQNLKASLHHILSQILVHFFEKSAEFSHLQSAITAAEKALQLTVNDNVRAKASSNLSRTFLLKYEHTFESEDLKLALNHAENAVNMPSTSADTMADCWGQLSRVLLDQYEQSTETTIINKAIEFIDKSLALKSEHDWRRAEELLVRALAYWVRYMRDRELSDLYESISQAREVMDTNHNSPNTRMHASHMLLLGLVAKVERVRKKEDRDEAINLIQTMNSMPGADVGSGQRYAQLSWLLEDLYKETRNLADLERSIEAAESAISVTSSGDPILGSFKNSLGKRLVCKYSKDKHANTLDAAISCFREAVRLTPENLSAKAQLVRNLATALMVRHDIGGMAQDGDEALELYLDATHDQYSHPLDRIESARGAIARLANTGQWVPARAIGERMLELVPILCRRYSSRQDQQHAISQISGFVVEVASLTIRTGDSESALGQLEFGRGLMLGYMIDERADLSALEIANPELAKRYQDLLSKVHAAEPEENHLDVSTMRLAAGVASQKTSKSRDQTSSRKLADVRRQALVDIENCISEIRKVPGFERFQTIPELSELLKIAAEGPIVLVNMTRISTDALILTSNSVETLHLPEMTFQNAPDPIRWGWSTYTSATRLGMSIDRDIAAVEDTTDDGSSNQYSWLWIYCVKPILDRLREMGAVSSKPGEHPRVWWIGSGAASALPFHAAGVDFAADSQENTLAQVTPSYTPTIKALGYSQTRASIPSAREADEDSVLLVTMPTTPGYGNLPGIQEERRAIENACKGAYQVKSAEYPSASDVLKMAMQSSIIHFACHGSSNRVDPIQSHLLLQKNVDGKVSVDKLTMLEMTKVAVRGHLRVAFFSACSTAALKDSQVADEGLHIASAAQIAGYVNVIGTLWPVRDDTCADISGRFYTELARRRKGVAHEGEVAEALRHAVIQLRGEPGVEPSAWAPFIHLGA